MPTTPFSSEHEALADSVRRLVEGPLADSAAAAERGGAIHRDVVGRCADLGLFELDDVLAQVAAAQALGRLRSGGLVRVVLDTMLAAAAGLAPTGGFVAVASDARVTVRHGALWGALPFVAGGSFAQRLLLPGVGAVVDLAAARIEPLVDPHALRGAAPAAVTFDATPYAPVEVEIGALHRWELSQAAAAVGAGWLAWDDAHRYAQEREAFGRPIGRFQVNRHALADAATALTAAEALVHDTAHAIAGGRDADPAPALLFAGQAAVAVADRALQLHGGYGYTTEFDLARAWRDARAVQVRSGRLRNRITTQGVLA